MPQGTFRKHATFSRVRLHDTKYKFYVYSKNPIYQQEGKEPYYRRLSYTFSVDMNTAKVSSFGIGSLYNEAEAQSITLTDLSLMTPELKSQLEEYATAELAHSFRDLADESVEVVGYYYKTVLNNSECMAACLTDRGTYESVKFSVYENYRGELYVNDFVTASSYNTCSTLEELLANDNVDASQFVSSK